jgi:hypothetical protein
MKAMRGASHAIGPYSPSYVRAAVIDAACSRSNAIVPASPTDASEGEIYAVKNCMAGGIKPKTSDLIPC